MATKTRRKAGSHKQTSNPRRKQNRRRNPVMVTRRRHARRNPGNVNIMEYVKMGGAVVAGAVGSKALTQLVLSTSNAGIMGYFGNLVATIALAYGSKMAFKDDKIAQGVVGGGLAQIIVRALTDYTPYGSVLANAGVGDYQTNWNFVWPQRVQPGYPPRFIQAAAIGGGPAVGVPVVTHAAPTGAKAGVGSMQRWN